MPDGEIQLAVTLSVDDVKRKSAQLRNEVGKIVGSADLSKLDKGAQTLLGTMDKLTSKAKLLEDELHRMETTKVANPIDEKYKQDLASAFSQYGKLLSNYKQLSQMANIGAGNTGDITTRLEKTKDALTVVHDKIMELYDLRQRLYDSGQGEVFLKDADPSKYEAVKNSLNEVNNQQSITIARFQQAGKEADNFGNRGSQAFSKMSAMAKPLSSAIGKVLSSMLNMAKTAGSKIVSAFKRVKNAISKAFNPKALLQSAKRLAAIALGAYSILGVFRKLKQYATEGLHNLVQFQSATNETNKAMTEFRTSMLYLKNAWAASFAPIINFVMPVLTSLIDKIAELGNAIARFVGALTGQAQVLNALKVNAGDYAKSLKGVGSSAKKATDRLAAFDDLNVLGKDNDGGGGGGGAYTPDPNEMFKYVDAFDSVDFTAIGEEFRDRLLEIFDIDWGPIKEKAHEIGTHIAEFLNGAFSDPALWTQGGRNIAEGLNTLGEFISGFLTTDSVDWGGNFALMINSFFESFDEDLFKSNLELLAQKLVDNINSFFSNLELTDEGILGDLTTMSEGITTALVTVIEGIDWAQIAESAYQIADAILAGIEEGLKSSDNPIIKGLGDVVGSIREALSSLTTIVAPILAVVGQLAETLLPIISTLLPPIASMIADLATTVMPLLSQSIGVVMPIIEELVNSVLPVLQTVIEALSPLLETFVSTFLPMFQEFLSEHIMPVLGKIIEFIQRLANHLAPLGEAIIALMGAALKPFYVLMGVVVDVVGALLDVIIPLIDPFIDLLVPIIDLMSLGFVPFTIVLQGVAAFITGVLVPVLQGLAYFIEAIIIPIVSAVTFALDILVAGLDVVMSAVQSLADTWYSSWSEMSDGFKSITNDIIAVAEGLANAVIKGINGAIDGINSLAIDIPDWVPEVGGNSVSFNLKKLSTISIPRLAQGAVIPPNKEFMAVLGDQKSGTNIEAPLDTIKQAVAEELSAQIGVMEQGFADVVNAINNKDLNIGDKQIGQANARYTARQNLIRGTSF